MEKKIEELNRLIAENPDYDVKMFVDSDEFADGFNFTSHRISSVKVSFWAQRQEYIFDDEDEFHDHLVDFCEYTEDEADKIIKETGRNVILIKTSAE